METVLIKIIKYDSRNEGSSGARWYKNSVGKVFRVVAYNRVHYRVDNFYKTCGIYLIRKEDCETIRRNFEFNVDWFFLENKN